MSTFIYSPDSVPAWQKHKNPAKVSKIVLGTLGKPIKAATLPDFASDFPNLKALHLWDLTELTSITSLPPSLEILDIRNCPNLTTIPTLPSSLYDLVLDNLPALQHLTTPENPSTLHDVAIVKCTGIQEDRIHQLLNNLLKSSHGRTLGCLDLSGCRQVKEIRENLPGFSRILLTDCVGLNVLPRSWPLSLTRIDLANTMVSRLPSIFPPQVDYVDLRNCQKLRRIPINWVRTGRLRTLYLSGSGVEMPPASQHGGESENVARKTREYFEEVAEVGEEEYLGCKILLLGSGGAGKTTLNLSLRGISQSHNPGSTHGILLEENPIADSSDGLTKTVHRTIWDFGGQELYHNTHTIFLKTNAVFVVVWNGEPNDFNINHQDPQNIQRPLRYWLDYIKIYGPKDPRIAVVRNWRRKKQADGHDEEEDRIPNESRNMIQHDFERATAGLSISCKLFIVNAFHKTSQYEDLRDWIDQNTISIARSQGTIIPATWHIAMMLIKPWIEADEPKDLPINKYSETLRSIFNCMKSDSHDLSHLIKRLGDRNPNQPVTASPQETIASWRAEYPLLYERIAEAEDFRLSGDFRGVRVMME